MLEYDRIDVSKGSDVNKTTIVMLVTFFDFSLQHLMIVIILHMSSNNVAFDSVKENN